MRNPKIRIVNGARRRIRYSRIVRPLKSRVLMALTHILTEQDTKAIRKALTCILNDDVLWANLSNLRKSVKLLAKHGISAGY